MSAREKTKRDEPGIRQVSQDKLTAKDRMAIPRTSMPQQNSSRRAGNFEEVNQGLSEAAAIQEARRCIQCKQ